MTDPKDEPSAPEAPTTANELAEDQLEQVSGGVGMLLPAVQKIREAAAHVGNEQLVDPASLNLNKIK